MDRPVDDYRELHLSVQVFEIDKEIDDMGVMVKVDQRGDPDVDQGSMEAEAGEVSKGGVIADTEINAKQVASGVKFESEELMIVGDSVSVPREGSGCQSVGSPKGRTGARLLQQKLLISLFWRKKVRRKRRSDLVYFTEVGLDFRALDDLISVA